MNTAPTQWVPADTVFSSIQQVSEYADLFPRYEFTFGVGVGNNVDLRTLNFDGVGNEVIVQTIERELHYAGIESLWIPETTAHKIANWQTTQPGYLPKGEWAAGLEDVYDDNTFVEGENAPNRSGFWVIRRSPTPAFV